MSSPGRRIAVVAIDGPAGAGKSTVARRVAERLNYAFLDTGAMYRAATWRAMHHGIDLLDRTALIASTRKMKLEISEGKVYVDGQDVTVPIRSPEVTRNIRALDGIPEVRDHLGGLQRKLGIAEPTVAEGRDMGTVIFPDAACKVYLDAGIEERARRRAAQTGRDSDVGQIRADIEARDMNDRSRDAAPLRAADDAHLIDTTGLSVDEVVERIVSLAENISRGD